MPGVPAQRVTPEQFQLWKRQKDVAKTEVWFDAPAAAGLGGLAWTYKALL